MPIVYSQIDIHDVKRMLKAKGYGFHSAYGVALQLNVPSKTRKRKIDGVPLRDLLRPIMRNELDLILTRSQTAEEACLHVEALSRGDDLAPEETLRAKDAPPGLSADQIAHLIDNRVGMQLQKEMEPLRNEMRGLIADVRAALSHVGDEEEEAQPKTKPAAKKKGKKGRPGKPTPEQVEEALKGMGLSGPAPRQALDD